MSTSSNSSATSVDTANASATPTGAGPLQAGIIQAAATQETTVASTDADAKTLSTTSSASSASEATSSSVSQTTITTSTKATSTTSSSTSSSTSAKVSSVSTSASSGTSTSTSSISVLQSKASSTTSASVSSSASPIAQSVQATQTPSSTATGSAAVEIVSTGTVDGHLTTLTTQVFAATSSSGQPTPTQLDSTETFFKNKAAVGGVFGAAGLIFLIVLLAVVLKIVRYRSRRKFEKDLDEQVQQEVRSGTPMFGLGKEDDGLSIMGGRAGVISDPEKAAYADSGYGYPNTAASYPTYVGSAPPQAAQPAYYSPNVYSSRRNPSRGQSQDFNYRDGGLSRVDSRGSARSYGTLNQPPMNAFGPSQAISAGANAPAFAPATFAAHYGEYRHASPAPSTQSWQSHNQAFGARPGTPSALTPGGRGNSIPAPPRNVYTPQDVRSDSPAVVARYSPSHSSRTSGDGYGADAYIAGRTTQIQTQNVGGLAVGPADGKEPPSPNVPLPNPFDQRDH